MKSHIKCILLTLLIAISLSSCVSVKPYEMVYINDPDMKLSERKAKKFHTAFHVYREGASGGDGEKSGGGCGCN